VSIYMRLPQTPRAYFWVCLVVGLAFVGAGVQQIASNVRDLRDAHRSQAHSAVATVTARVASLHGGSFDETVTYTAAGRTVHGAMVFDLRPQQAAPVGGTIRIVPGGNRPGPVSLYTASKGPSAIRWIESVLWLAVAVPLFAVSRRRRQDIR
jgi:hypothetical protein